MHSIYNLFINIIPFLTIGFFIGRNRPKLSEQISKKLIKFGIPLSVMGLLLKAGINIDLIKTSLLAFFSIALLVFIINSIKILKHSFSNFSLQLGGLIGNTSFLGIPIAIALLPTNTINFTIGFDLGTTLFAWVFGPIFLQKNIQKFKTFNHGVLINSVLSSPASRGIIGALIAYLFRIDSILGNVLWIPARIVIIIAIVIVGTRLGIITKDNQEGKVFKNELKISILLKLIIFPIFILALCKLLQFNDLQTQATVLQAATPSAISTILMAEAYKTNQELAASILFRSTVFSIISIPIWVLLIR